MLLLSRTIINEMFRRFLITRTPQVNVLLGFLGYTLAGFILLSLPFLQKVDVSFIDNLFIATSAVSTTGLVTISVFDSYNFFGQLVVLLLFQVGGIGYMTLTIYFLLSTSKTITRWHSGIIDAEFTMPKTIKIKDFIKSLIVFTVVMEILGTICFFIAFNGEGKGFFVTLWDSIFHSVSAFCTAGFSLNNSSFVEYQNNTFVNTIISVLAISGSLGFIVITDMWYRISGQSKQLTFTTKIILVGFIILLSAGTTLIYFTEPATHINGDNAFITSFFQTMTAMTTVGFNTIDTGALRLPILLFVVFLMYLGASPSGTAGGMKITTLTAMLSILWSRLKGRKKITFLNRLIPFERLYVATSTFILYTSIIFVATFLLAFTEEQALDKLLFEAASALGTVGLSTGITGDLSFMGKAIITAIMFIGRVGVLTFGFALISRKIKGEQNFLEDDIAV